MTKLEKVISGLWHCERISCNNCPYAGQDEDGRSPYKTCKQLEMLGDALGLLKERQWVSVKDRMPPNDDTKVMTYGNPVTHWMPLPEPPKEGDSE